MPTTLPSPDDIIAQQSGVSPTPAPESPDQMPSPDDIIQLDQAHPFVGRMLAKVGKPSAFQCGAAISKQLQSSGFNTTASGIVRNGSQVQPDASGNYPYGTILFFPPKGGIPRGQIGSNGSEHFAISLGNGRVAESTQAGADGGWHVRSDRTIAQIASAHGGVVQGYQPPSKSKPAAVPQRRPLPRRTIAATPTPQAPTWNIPGAPADPSTNADTQAWLGGVARTHAAMVAAARPAPSGSFKSDLPLPGEGVPYRPPARRVAPPNATQQDMAAIDRGINHGGGFSHGAATDPTYLDWLASADRNFGESARKWVAQGRLTHSPAAAGLVANAAALPAGLYDVAKSLAGLAIHGAQTIGAAAKGVVTPGSGVDTEGRYAAQNYMDTLHGIIGGLTNASPVLAAKALTGDKAARKAFADQWANNPGNALLDWVAAGGTMHQLGRIPLRPGSPSIAEAAASLRNRRGQTPAEVVPAVPPPAPEPIAPPAADAIPPMASDIQRQAQTARAIQAMKPETQAGANVRARLQARNDQPLPPGQVEPIVDDAATPPAVTMRPPQGKPYRGSDTHPPTADEALPDALAASLRAQGKEPPISDATARRSSAIASQGNVAPHTVMSLTPRGGPGPMSLEEMTVLRDVAARNGASVVETPRGADVVAHGEGDPNAPFDGLTAFVEDANQNALGLQIDKLIYGKGEPTVGAPSVAPKPALTLVNSPASMSAALQRHMGLAPDEATASSALFDARAKQWAVENNSTPAEFYRRYVAGVTQGESGSGALHQDIPSPTTIIDAAKKHFGVTNDPREAGYVTPDGQMLDFSGRHEGNLASGARTVDHRQLPEDLTGGKSGTDGMIQFQEGSGALRIHADPVNNILYAEPVRALTPNQIGLLRRVGRGQNVTVEVQPAHGDIRTFGADNASDADITRLARQANAALGDTLFQGPKGAVSFLDDGRAVIHALKDPDVSTAVHELGHIFRRTLNDVDRKAAEAWAGVKDGNWQRSHEEKFARGFEQYLAEGKFPTVPMRTVFEKFKAWLGNIYGGIKGSAIDAGLSDEMRQMFGRILGGKAPVKESLTTESVAPLNASPEPVKNTAENGQVPTVADNATVAPSNMVGSTNLDRIQASDVAKAKITATAHGLGLVGKPALTDAQAIQGARDLGVSIDDLRAIPPGEIPTGVEPKIWQLAVRNLRNHYAEAASDAEAVNRETPSVANQASADIANENHRLAMQHADEVAQRGGQLLQGHSVVSYNEKAVAAQRAIQKAPRLAETNAPKPAGKSYGSRNRIVTKADYDGLKGEVAKWFKQSAGRASAGIDPSVLAPLTKMAIYHLEAGAREFGAWLGKMKADTGADLSVADWQALYANARGALGKAVAAQQSAAVKPVFVDQLAAGLGSRLRASKFVDAIRDADGSNTILDKLIHGGELTPAQMQIIADAWAKNVSSRSFRPTMGAMATVRQIVKDARGPRPARPSRTRTGAQVVDDSLRARVGPDAAKAVRADLGSDAVGQSALAKLEANEPLTPAEGRRFAQAVDAFRGIKPKPNPHAIIKQMRTVIADARAGRLGYDSPKDFAKDVLGKHFKGVDGVIDPAKYDAAVRDLGNLDDGDYAGIAHTIMRHLADDGDNYQHFVRSNILSGLQTLGRIIGAHNLTISAEEFRRFVRNPASSALGTATALRAGVRAVPDSIRLMKSGPLAMQLAGKDALHTPGDPIHTELSSRDPLMHRALAPYRIPMRVHGAIYHVMQTYNFERGLFIEAEKAAKAKGLRGTSYRNAVADARLNPTPAMTEAAIRFAREETQTNPNRAAAWLTSLDRLGPIGKVIRTNIAPVASVPMNSVGRQIEMATGSISAPMLARLYAHMHPEATPAEVAAYRQKVFERGLVGAGIMAYGFYRQQTGQSNAPDPAHGEYGSINARGKKWDVGQYGNVGGLLNTGAIAGEIYDRFKAHDAPTAGEAAGKLFEPFADNPYTRINENAQTAANIFTGEDPRKAARAEAGVVSMHKPFSAFLSQTAALTDPSKGIRSKQTLADYIKNAQPGYREDLPLTSDPNRPGHPYPQPGFFREVPMSSVHRPSRLEAAIARRLGPSPGGTFTDADRASYAERRALMPMVKALGSKPLDPKSELGKRLAHDIDTGLLTQANVRFLAQDANEPPVVAKFGALGSKDITAAADIFEHDATEADRRMLAPALAALMRSAQRKGKLTPQENARLTKDLTPYMPKR